LSTKSQFQTHPKTNFKLLLDFNQLLVVVVSKWGCR
jgi:hypothetical protein